MEKRRIVLIDDDVDFTEAMATFLNGHGFQAKTSNNGKEGLALVKEFNPDLILLDVMMDYLNEGFVVAGEIKKDPVLSRIPVIFLTGFEQYMNEENMDSFTTILASWNAAALINKPIEPTKLLEQIEKILG